MKRYTWNVVVVLVALLLGAAACDNAKKGGGSENTPEADEVDEAETQGLTSQSLTITFPEAEDSQSTEEVETNTSEDVPIKDLARPKRQTACGFPQTHIFEGAGAEGSDVEVQIASPGPPSPGSVPANAPSQLTLVEDTLSWSEPNDGSADGFSVLECVDSVKKIWKTHTVGTTETSVTIEDPSHIYLVASYKVVSKIRATLELSHCETLSGELRCYGDFAILDPEDT